MAESRKPAIFVSSTFRDLAATRAKLVKWLSGLFGSDLIIMETFGSDAAPPQVSSVRRVRDCDIFIGVYGHRYGTIDGTSNQSITELELDEAKRSHSAGSVAAILLYLIEDNSPWLSKHTDHGTLAQTGMARLRQKASQHTSSFFRTESELLFQVVRDIHRFLSATSAFESPLLRPFVLPPTKRIMRPSEMEFLTAEDRDYLLGRRAKLLELLKRCDKDPVVLLLGDSGVGKTSLIHAGLIPQAINKAWRPIYTRPFGLPCSDVTGQVYSSVYDTGTRYRGALFPLLHRARERPQGHQNTPRY